MSPRTITANLLYNALQLLRHTVMVVEWLDIIGVRILSTKRMVTPMRLNTKVACPFQSTWNKRQILQMIDIIPTFN